MPLYWHISMTPTKDTTDASYDGLGAVLSHVPQTEPLEAFTYASRTMSQAKKNYSVSEQEVLGVVWAVETFDAYLDSRKSLKVITDHNALSGLFKMKTPEGG